MGTNYFHRYNKCSHCNRYDERHIGMQSAGWEFSFQAFTDDEYKPFLKSWAEWKEALKAGQIFDEYEREISLDEFIAKVEATKGRKNHYDSMIDYAKRHGPSYMDGEWKDAEGWSFSLAQFS